MGIDGRALAANQPAISASTERQWQGIRRPKILASPGIGSRAAANARVLQQWDEADWDHDMTRRRAIAPAGCCRVRARAFTGRRSGRAAAPLDGGERWVKRLAVAAAALVVIFVVCFGGLWWRLGAGPINLDIATPWLAAAIEENIGHGNTVEVGGTQIERAGRIRIAVRIRDIVVRDRDRAIVATRPRRK